MASMRRKLRVFAGTWLVFQVSWLAALVPRDCCAAHRPADKSCHESPSATHCPMPAADGTPCPAHRRQGEHSEHRRTPSAHDHQSVATDHHDHTPPPKADCRLTGGCDGPLSAFFVLLSNHGILPEPASTPPILEDSRAAIAADVNPIGRFESPDSPPPRA